MSINYSTQRIRLDALVDWVEERNPTPQSLVIVGFHFVQTPVATSRETRPTHWLPNLRICFILFINWYEPEERMNK